VKRKPETPNAVIIGNPHHEGAASLPAAGAEANALSPDCGNTVGYSYGVGSGQEAVARAVETLVREHPGMIEDLLDEHYSRDLVKKIPKLVRRTVRLSSLIVKDTPSTAVNLYSSEATRNYVFGFWPSCIALTRRLGDEPAREHHQQTEQVFRQSRPK
jgi:hypothetical protein